MKTIFKISLAMALLSSFGSAQQATFQDSLLDHLAGAWILQGTIAGQETTHDILAEWVLGHQYLQLREISREKSAAGAPAYEAIVFIGWDQPLSQYACLWLDVTGGGGLTGQAIGHAQRNGDTIPFLFKGADGSLFHTTFVYDKGTDSWQWLMDGEENGKRQPFARVNLTKK
ncbi:MAG: hypothetical protein ACYDH3_00755 [Candidatus Aminicenantales bacterium]